MPHEILSVKLCELDEEISQLHGRILLSQTAGHERLQEEIQALRRECDAQEFTIRNRLQHSRTEWVRPMAEAFDQVDRIIRSALEEASLPAPDEFLQEATAEEQLLLAEYMLDFALQAADRALLASLTAIDTQLCPEKNDEGSYAV